MKFIKLPFIFVLIILILIRLRLTIAQPDFLKHYCNYDYTVTYAYGSTFDTNLDTIPSYLTVTGQHFYNFSIGPDLGRVNVIALCRENVADNLCSTCFNNSITNLRKLCTNERQAIGWYDECMLRYSDLPIANKMEIVPNASTYNTTTVSDPTKFNEWVRTMLNRLRGEAAGNGPVQKFATEDFAAPGNLTIYSSASTETRISDVHILGIAECTPDLSEKECGNCLNGAVEEIQLCCGGKIGARVLRPSCNLKYEIGSFSVDAPPLPPPPPPPGNNKIVIIVVVVSTFSFVVLVACIFIFIKKKRKLRIPNENFPVDEKISADSLRFNFDTIKVATNDFSVDNKLGQGGFGAVFKGKLQNGQEIAVKRLSTRSNQGEDEFENEVALLANLQHRNLVRLLGFCQENKERLLIYEFVPNASLNHFIFDPVQRATLTWENRHKIIKGIARGLLYLHEDSRLRIIHRDLKPGNVLLDEDMNPKIADFGLARLFGLDETHGTTLKVAGTFGYMAPEYLRGKFSVKSDVFSFGVVVLEIISGEKNSDLQNEENVGVLVSYAWKNWREGTTSNLIDPKLKDVAGSMVHIIRCIQIGLLCVQENVAERPAMDSVVLMLNSVSFALKEPLEPGKSKTEPAQLSINDVTISELNPR